MLLLLQLWLFSTVNITTSLHLPSSSLGVENWTSPGQYRTYSTQQHLPTQEPQPRTDPLSVFIACKQVNQMRKTNQQTNKKRNHRKAQLP
ncbi:hypothetical protein AALO_G00163260 [Alosa alosa]|uniref:Secreted protein n=1 Tax=Alosa alosa TaxID=278164 RepID=A0AAV6GBC2_9TELE|nr:hypothetical protein AALO_G00163260 [Alosa alosa]